MTHTLCRDCAHFWTSKQSGLARCPACGGARLTRHAELGTLTLAHIDCDAFYATVEKRDDPSLAAKPVIVGGGGSRGVVAACCYLARMTGVRSAMPIFQARQRCPDAVIIPPNMAKYEAAGQAVRQIMRDYTPMVEPLSIDEAFLDLSGTERLHHAPPAVTLARLIRRIEAEVGVTASVGLSYNKFLAKVASDLDKPRGFAVIGQAEAEEFLADKPVGLMWGVGKVLQKRLEKDGITIIAHLKAMDESTLIKRYGSIGSRLYWFSRGLDGRTVVATSAAKSISAETTFSANIRDGAELKRRLWALCEKVSRRLKAKELAGGSVTLKLKTAEFKLLTRSHKLTNPTRFAEHLYDAARPMLEKEADGRAFRLIGVGAAALTGQDNADQFDLADPERERRTRIEEAMDTVRNRFGAPSVVKGRGLKIKD